MLQVVLSGRLKGSVKIIVALKIPSVAIYASSDGQQPFLHAAKCISAITVMQQQTLIALDRGQIGQVSSCIGSEQSGTGFHCKHVQAVIACK